MVSLGLVSVLAFCLGISGCASVVNVVSREYRPLSFIGHIAFGPPAVEGRKVVVPLVFSGGLLEESSALIVQRVDAQVTEGKIVMSVVIASTDEKPEKKRELVLRGCPPGSYDVLYRDPDGTRHLVGRINIPK